jgi:hypothetical protein
MSGMELTNILDLPGVYRESVQDCWKSAVRSFEILGPLCKCFLSSPAYLQYNCYVSDTGILRL